MNKFKIPILLLIILLGIIIRFIPISGLTSGPISYNVGITLSAASEAEFNKGSDLIGSDQAPLRYIILHYFLFLGRDEFIIRLPALLFGIASLLLIYRLGKLFFGVNIGLLSSFLLSASLWHIHHSTYAETYTLYVFLSLLSVFFFYKNLKEESISSQIKFILTSVLGFYSFYPFVTIIFAESLWFFLFFKKDKKRMAMFFISLIAIMVLILPGLISAYHGFQWKSNFGDYFWGWKLSELFPSLLSMFGGIKNFIPINIFIFLLGFFAVSLRKTERGKGLFLFFLVVFSCLFFLSCFLLRMNLTERYFLFIYPFFIILSSYGILSIRNRIVSTILIFLFCSSSFLFILDKCGFDTKRYIPEDYLRHYADFKFPANYLNDNYKEGDAVVIEQGPGISATQYYLDKSNAFPVKIIKPFCGAIPYYRYDGDRIKNFFGLVEYDQTPKRLKKIWKTHNRLWLIDLNHIHYSDKYGKIQKWISENYSKKIKFQGGTIYLLNGEFKKSLSKKEIYECNKMVCFLECKGEIKKIIYPYSR